ncbi:MULTISPECIES: hypothetical protein [Paenibacillus]|uniref:hypothetical protein n=1 Tax=Paenibacillus TaxID=44249 RepID=UPI0012D932E5|nr:MULTISPECIES: hypothetical protein [Paenibacillus]
MPINSKNFKAAVILLAAAMAVSPTASASNNGTTSSRETAPAANTSLNWNVKLGNGVTASLEQADVWNQDSGNVAVFTLRYRNGGKSPARLVTYFPKAVLPGGDVKAANPITKDLAKKKVEPGQSLSVTYYVKTEQASISGMKLVMDVWNPKVKGYLERVGSYRIPATYSAAVASGAARKLSLGGTPVTVKAESLEVIKYDGKVYAKVGMSLTNHGSRVWTDNALNPYLATGSGSAFQLQREAGTEGVPVQPKERKKVYYITEIPSYLKTTDLRFLWTETDDTLKLDLPVASFKLPKAITPQWDVPEGEAKALTISGQPVRASVRQALLRVSGDQAIWNIEVAFKNNGKKSVTIPAYDYAIKASEGSLYPYEAEDRGALTIKLSPGEERAITLDMALPAQLDQERLRLRMIAPSGEYGTIGKSADQESGSPVAPTEMAHINLPLAYFSIPYQTERRSSIGVEYPPQSPQGFAYTLESIQRLPWQDTDLVVAKLRLRNPHETNSILLPELTAEVIADEKVLLSAPEVIAEEQGSRIAPGAATEVYVMAKIPYTNDIQTLRFRLSTQQDSAKSPFLTWTASGHAQSVERLEQGKPYSIKTAGKRSELQERRTIIYEGTDSDIIYSEFTLASSEQRRIQAPLMKGYFQGTSGQIYEAETVQPETPLQPGAKQLVTFWARVPKGAGNDLQLALGTAMTGNKLAESGTEATGIMSVKKLTLNPIRPATSRSLTQLDWYPYNISVTKLAGSLQEGSPTISLNLTFDVKRTDSITAADAGHKLILTIKDSLGQTQERVLTPGTDIQVPGTRTVSLELTDEQYKRLRGGWLSLTLSDEFQNERIIMGSQTVNLTFYPNSVPDSEW